MDPGSEAPRVGSIEILENVATIMQVSLQEAKACTRPQRAL